MVKVLGKDFPACAHAGCNKHGEDGYCLAGCCFAEGKAYCSEHSHRPTQLLEILGYEHDQTAFTRDEVRRIILAMWSGAGLVFESSGYMLMLKHLKAKRESAGGTVAGLNGLVGV